MGSSVDAPPSRDPDTTDDDAQSKIDYLDGRKSKLKLGELLSGRLSDAAIDSVAAVRDGREP
ncbi:hypothetical protein [Haloarcula onubensis]|uniref:Antitoxin n=1 Tax=Haloarcula onubensis TaxID=2950539 RepID=A0ABU2FQZ4_9EURY|nr:hypothetical protein [Halomicroarcula sp. S3CR25-11]MDS0283188.1 hypothetical protein [Halomicroarcula sp. S3CR25-11]